MTNTLLGFGLFALAAAIIGGGLKAFGFEISPLQSLPRQVLLGTLGAALILIAEWPKQTPTVQPAAPSTPSAQPLPRPVAPSTFHSTTLVQQGTVDDNANEHRSYAAAVPRAEIHPSEMRPQEITAENLRASTSASTQSEWRSSVPVLEAGGFSFSSVVCARNELGVHCSFVVTNITHAAQVFRLWHDCRPLFAAWSFASDAEGNQAPASSVSLGSQEATAGIPGPVPTQSMPPGLRLKAGVNFGTEASSLRGPITISLVYGGSFGCNTVLLKVIPTASR